MFVAICGGRIEASTQTGVADMKKLNDQIKYKIVTEEGCSHVELFAKRLADGKTALVGTCHLACIDYIKTNGMRATVEAGLIRFAA
jgi:hypothetical protein